MSTTKVIGLGMGNPLLDISAEVKAELLTKYKLDPSNAILAEAEHMPLYEELKKDYDVSLVPGGSAMNSIRVAQWFLEDADGSFGYIGSIGKDENGDAFRKSLAADGIQAAFSVDEKEPTGTCAALITNGQRSLVANLAAANAFKADHLSSDAGAKSMLAEARVFYVTSFFLTHSPEAAMEMAKVAAERKVPLVVNVSAPFLVEVPIFKERVIALLEYADYVFCNEHEAAAVGKALEFGDDLTEVARKLAASPKKTEAPRTVVFTQGSEPAIVIQSQWPKKVATYAPIKLAEGELVDENGAGDAYVGGFLAGLVKNQSLDQCFDNAAFCAWTIIRRQGCSFPEKKEEYPQNK